MKSDFQSGRHNVKWKRCKFFYDILLQKKVQRPWYQHILTSNENATPICTLISEGYIEYTKYLLSQRISCDFMNTKYRHHIDFISFNVKGLNVYTHTHIPTVIK